MTQTNKLSNAEINRKIAEYLGWKVVVNPFADDSPWMLLAPDGLRKDWLWSEDYEEAWRFALLRGVPNWAGNLEAALELCLLLLDRLNEANYRDWEMVFGCSFVAIQEIEQGGTIGDSYSANGRDTDALVQVALEVIKARNNQ